MKNGLLIWNIVLTIVAGYLLFNQFSSKKSNDGFGRKGGRDSSAAHLPFRIAYFEMDSVENNFQAVKDVKAEINKKEDEINMQMNRMAKDLQDKYTFFQNKAQSGTMSAEEREQATMTLKSMDDEIKGKKQEFDQRYNEFVATKMKEVKNKIETFLKEYNKTKNYSYIISYEQGLFYYRDSALNITEDVIKGLNDFYKNKKG